MYARGMHPDAGNPQLAMVGFVEAAHIVRMTPRLLRWFTSYSPKNDGQKLPFKTHGKISLEDLHRFDTYLRDPWPSRSVPAGISQELRREACGKCGLCDAPVDTLHEAHIDRKGIEVEYYQQHPHNLMLLCPNCHTRYDQRTKGSITNDVVRSAKMRMVSRLLEGVDRDIALEKMIRNATSSQPNQHHTQTGRLDMPQDRVDALIDVVTKMQAQLASLEAAQEKITSLERSLGAELPVSAARLSTLSHQTTEGLPSIPTPDADDLWMAIPPGPEFRPGECMRGDGSYALLEDAYCEKCDQDLMLSPEEPIAIDYDASGKIVSVYLEEPTGYKGETEAVRVLCEKCNSDNDLEFSFGSYCSYCQHMYDKMMDD